MDLLRLLLWNCRGASNNIFKRNLVEIIRTHKPEILILMETKVPLSRMSNFFNRLGFTALSIVNPIVRVGGIWIIWDTSQVNVRVSSISSQAIYATIYKEDYEEWVLAAVYASPNPALRDSLWNDLEGVTENMDKPWLVADHSPLVVFTQGMHTLTPSKRPFRFEAALMTHLGLIDIIKSTWADMHNNLLEATVAFTIRVKEWKKEVYGNIFKRKRYLLARIERTQRNLAVRFTYNLHLLEKDLIKQYNAVLA
ncbi:uncharacterized protein LOC114321519 [Camellia sinensis]|uniref:uncharacterized protein LOC114321519 n=1 Tax=Camellia sinensis TaxID=4442 RepID=UPI00103582AF|nr:uncharacterized protein LOC114321519 [Camellia sinensis]